MTPELNRYIMREIVVPTMRGMKERGVPYRGVLFVGLIINESGPKVIEFNVRFGDPEAEVILPRLEDDLLERVVPDVVTLVCGANDVLVTTRPEHIGRMMLAAIHPRQGHQGRHQYGHSQEHPPPPEELGDEPPDHRADGQRDPDAGAPERKGPRTLTAGECFADDCE